MGISALSAAWAGQQRTSSSLDSQGAILLRISSHHHLPFSDFEKRSYFLSSFYINGRRNVETQTHFFFIVSENKKKKKKPPSQLES